MEGEMEHLHSFDPPDEPTDTFKTPPPSHPLILYQQGRAEQKSPDQRLACGQRRLAKIVHEMQFSTPPCSASFRHGTCEMAAWGMARRTTSTACWSSGLLYSG